MGAATQFWASQLIVGDAGAGTFLAEESAQVSTTDLIAGRQSGASGSIVLSDGGTFLFSQITEIGVAGTADMTIQNGALMTTSWYADIGYSPGGKGEVYVTGAGSRWNAGSLAIGSTQSTGLLNVSNGGIVYADRTRPGRDVVRIDTLGRLEGDGGTLQVVLGMLVNRGTIAPGPGLGSLTIDGSVDFYTSGRLEIDIFGPPSSSLNDLLVVTGFAVLSGTLVLDFTNYTPAFGSTYTYLAANAIFGDFTNFSVIGLNPAFVQFDTPNGQFTIIPEPATASLLGLAGLALLRRRHSGLRSGTD